MPKTVATNSANGLRRERIPRPPKEMLMRKKMESLQDECAKREAGAQVGKVTSLRFADSVEWGRQRASPGYAAIKSLENADDGGCGADAGGGDDDDDDNRLFSAAKSLPTT